MLDTGSGFPYCRFYAKCCNGAINDADDKMYVPEGTIMGIGQDWLEEEQETEEYSEPVAAVRGLGRGSQNT